MAGGTVTCETSTLKLLTPSSRARHTAIAFAGAVVSNPTAKKTTCLSGVRIASSQRVERRVDHPHGAAARAHLLQVAVAAGHAQHVAERGEDHVGPRRQRERLVDLLERRDAHRAARPVDHLDGAVDAVRRDPA